MHNHSSSWGQITAEIEGLTSANSILLIALAIHSHVRGFWECPGVLCYLQERCSFALHAEETASDISPPLRASDRELPAFWIEPEAPSCPSQFRSPNILLARCWRATQASHSSSGVRAISCETVACKDHGVKRLVQTNFRLLRVKSLAFLFLSYRQPSYASLIPKQTCSRAIFPVGVMHTPITTGKDSSPR